MRVSRGTNLQVVCHDRFGRRRILPMVSVPVCPRHQCVVWCFAKRKSLIGGARAVQANVLLVPGKSSNYQRLVGEQRVTSWSSTLVVFTAITSVAGPILWYYWKCFFGAGSFFLNVPISSNNRARYCSARTRKSDETNSGRLDWWEQRLVTLGVGLWVNRIVQL